MKCCCTMPIPCLIASRGLCGAYAAPFSTIDPESGFSSPYRIFISVVLPAPFSPTTARISPGESERSTAEFASREPNHLVIPFISRIWPKTESSRDDAACVMPGSKRERRRFPRREPAPSIYLTSIGTSSLSLPEAMSSAAFFTLAIMSLVRIGLIGFGPSLVM